MMHCDPGTTHGRSAGFFTRSFFLLLALILACRQVPGQDLSVQAALDTNLALIGDQLRLSIRLEKPAGARVTFPEFRDTLTGGIEIVSRSAVDTARDAGGRETLQQELLITVFDTGFFEVPPLPFAFRKGPVTDTLRTLPVYFEIRSMPADTTIRDIRANMKAPVNAAEIFPFALGAVVLAIAGYLVYLWLRKRKKKAAGIIPEMPAEPEDVIALRELARLREERPWLHRQVKPYYIRLTEILRHYIERRFSVMALEQTTGEILASLKQPLDKNPGLKRLSGILMLADLVKFAKVIPGDDENAAQVEEAVAFVNETALQKEETVQEVTLNPEPVNSNAES